MAEFQAATSNLPIVEASRATRSQWVEDQHLDALTE
jgi:hypothetical protein